LIALDVVWTKKSPTSGLTLDWLSQDHIVETTLPEEQVGVGVSPSLDDDLILTAD
jgi:hypothetical protein